ncbi:NAD(P)-dependent oxidoreductase [Bacillus pumilus]|uniref:NAD-dependent epimerase/dehydratase family protein n=1 Tax=Bacillus TaxID=1386 RepID=UPI00017A6B90|nr:NAD(P)-dependent oxidoreductase [Bacillus pumilus]EDW20024.1 YtbQ [Bacillus pumilus ATCC 7061]MCR4353108.1 NAD(P)-dependent oxidoreductase [Bacillus pumilus]MCY7506690.1 NAD(P)-dependent oxidoreductase [Bacillus pumilus]MDR4271645.1 NAD(P)-dependent oxidoreductase [Bacillus pumilus]MED4630853.1 NAD(P)-dependent oxidoreductase [Bacillus pumilus]
MKKITIIGGCGVIGRILTKTLSSEYEITIIDQTGCVKGDILADATNEQELYEAIPRDTDVIIHLLNMEMTHDVMNHEEFEKMNDIFWRSSYSMFRSAASLGIRKVIFASSNHVTDRYEKDGRSLLGRHITTNDVPATQNVYGILKFASEQLGRLFHDQTGMSVINLRIGTVVTDEMEALHEKDRTKRTLLSHEDLAGMIKAAIETTVPFGTYYAVSENEEKPWSTENTKQELGYRPDVNTTEILEENDQA